MAEAVQNLKPFWTFAVKTVKVDSGKMTVKGWFVSATQGYQAPEPGEEPRPFLRVHYLTPVDKPTTIDITPLIPNNVKIDDVSPRMLVAAMTRLFALDFQPIPKTPPDVPKHRVPPHKRQPQAERLDLENLGY
jgi:hypothetical protein